VPEIRDNDRRPPDDGSELADFLVRSRQELVEQTQLADYVERRRMHGVAAKSRRKVGVFSSTTTSTPARASRKPSIIPAGPPPATQQSVSI